MGVKPGLNEGLPGVGKFGAPGVGKLGDPGVGVGGAAFSIGASTPTSLRRDFASPLERRCFGKSVATRS